ncbi:MAG: hypothetical protein RLO48_02620, partial [Bauldia litoralis]
IGAFAIEDDAAALAGELEADVHLAAMGDAARLDAADRANELQLYRHGEPAGDQGFKTIRIDGAHPDYGAFIPAPAHGLGFNDLKTIELHGFLRAIAAGGNLAPDLDEACRIARVCDAVLDSSTTGARIDRPEANPSAAHATKALNA